MAEKEYVLDQEEAEEIAYLEAERKEQEEKEEREQKEKEGEPMGDVYDVYQKAVAVHSTISGMTEDYTLTRYNQDVYNQKFPKFIREQRKLLRIIKSYIIIPLPKLRRFYNTEEKAKEVYRGLVEEFKIIEELLIGELDECVIMGRTPQGEVINAFLKHGLQPESRDTYDLEVDKPTARQKATERTAQ